MTGLCLLSEVRAIRGSDDPNTPHSAALEAIYKRFILATSRYAEKHCHRVLVQQQFTEYFDGNNATEKYLSQPNRAVPISATAPAAILYSHGIVSPFTDTLIAATEYELFDDGMLRYPAGFACGKRNYKCIYYPGFDTTGWDTIDLGGSGTFGVPEDLSKAIAMQTCINLKKASGKVGDARLGLTSKGIMETESIDSYVTGIEPEVAEFLAQYVKVTHY